MYLRRNVIKQLAPEWYIGAIKTNYIISRALTDSTFFLLSRSHLMITLFIDLTLCNKNQWIALCVYVYIEKYLSITARNCVTAKYLYNLNCWLLLWLVIKFTVHYFLHSAMQRAIVFKDKKDHKFTYINCKSRYSRKEERTVVFTCFTHIINETERKIFISSLAVSTGVQIARYSTMEYYCKIEYRSSALLSHRDAWLLETPLCCIGYKKKKKRKMSMRRSLTLDCARPSISMSASVKSAFAR